MSRVIRTVFKTDAFSLIECPDGYWLHDYVRGFNISIRAKTEQEALLNGLVLYQKDLKDARERYKDIMDKVDAFFAQFDHE